MLEFLDTNGPWSQLIALGNIERRRVEFDRAGQPSADGVRVTAFRVPHRDEFSDTVGYRIEGPRQSALFIPDIDRWEKWERSIRDVAEHASISRFSTARSRRRLKSIATSKRFRIR